MEFTPTHTAAWQAADNAHYLHPFTDYEELRREGGARVVVRGEGCYVWDTEGHKVLDGLAGLGCVTVGYGRKELAKAASDQLEKLGFCQSFFKTTNQPAIALAKKLVEIAPPGLNHVFFQSSGSEANDTAARLVRHYWDLVGQPERKVLIARMNAYHGSTMAAASLSGIPPLHWAGGDLPLPNIVHIDAPYHYLNGPDLSAHDFGVVAAQWLEQKILEVGPNKVAAFFGEPVQGAGGAIVAPDSYWPEIQRICRKYDVLLVADEVVSGFGRTGNMWGCQTYNIAPDIINLAKGITSAYAPLSANLIGDRIADVLIAKGGEWYHGFTYSGHPMCCAVALENIRILENERLVERVRDDVGPYFASKVRALADHPLVGDARSVGLLAGMQLVKNKATRELFDEATGVGPWCMAWALKNGLALRAIGDTMALMPPLIITHDELDFVFDVTRATFDAAAKHFNIA